MSVLQSLKNIIESRGASYVILIDPDKNNQKSILSQVETANCSNVDAIFVGGSLMMDMNYNDRVEQIKKLSNIPVVLFPGGVNQINKYFDAVLFMSLLSGRNPHYLIGEQVISAPIIKDLKLETIPTGYILLDGGTVTSVEFMSGTRPIPMDKEDIVASHALAGQYLGMQFIYLEAGSGAEHAVTKEIIEVVDDTIDIPIIVGGGIRTPSLADLAVKAGASVIVTGTAVEKNSNCMEEFANAVHWKG
ncbi:MAG: geranylgeranylglyceryl/heptaprenylglyceryl phosphate synthase [Candidatus Marinimicrobia bacterium]|nr:geranylgeranylglyceryl/heptaprenylglyceryl phosphate synthase [Candidatus Neomarinimicrobiota bacterium]